MGLPTLTGGDTTDNVGAIGDGLFSMEGALFSGKSLNDDTGLSVD
jgi:hypothetical protein